MIKINEKMSQGTNKIEFIIIVGCGRLGSQLANFLSKEQNSVIIIDKNEAAFGRLNEDFSGFAIVADATELDILLDAKIDKADIVITTTNDDNTNIMIAQIAKKIYCVPKVIARLFEPSRQGVYDELDIETICPVTLSANALINLIRGQYQEVNR